MKKVKDITDEYETLYKASKALNIHQSKLTRWIDAGAIVLESGDVYIKTKGAINYVWYRIHYHLINKGTVVYVGCSISQSGVFARAVCHEKDNKIFDSITSYHKKRTGSG